MRLTQLRLEAFAGLRDTEIAFRPEVNVVLGPNEAGKSTVHSALLHLLLTKTALTKTQLRSTVGHLMPRPSGNTISAALELEAPRATDDAAANGSALDHSGSFALEKTWGEGAVSIVRSADSLLRGPDAESKIDTLRGVSQATYRALFVVSHTTLHRTMETLSDDHETQDAIYRTIRAVSSGSVSAEQFLRTLDERIKGELSRWDYESHLPERARGIDRPWGRDVGTVLKSWYEWQRELASLREAQEAEASLEQIDAELTRLAGQIDETEEFVTRWTESYEKAKDAGRRKRERQAIEDQLAAVRTAIRRWPVLIEEINRLDATKGKTREEVERAQELVDRERHIAEESALLSTARSVVELVAKADQLRAEIEALGSPSRDVIVRMSEAEKELERLGMLESSGELTLSLRLADGADQAMKVTVGGSDDSDPARIHLDPGEEHDQQVTGTAEIQVSELTIAVQAGTVSPASIQRRAAEISETLSGLREESGVATSAEGRETLARRALLEEQLEEISDRIERERGDHSVESLTERAAELPAAPAGEHTVDAATLLADAREALGRVAAEEAAFMREAEELERSFNSQDAAEARFAELSAQLAAISSDDGTGVDRPPEFTDDAEFVSAFEARQQMREDLNERRNAARVTQAERFARLPDRTSEEIEASAHSLQALFEAAERHAETLLRLRSAAERVAASDRRRPAQTIEELLSHYLAAALHREPETLRIDDGAIAPTMFADGRSAVLEGSLLSQGTQDIVALCIHLALAEIAATGAYAPPLLLDDPLVNMDPERRVGAARAITAYAQDRQLVLFTCHPDHASLFDETAIIRME